MVVVVSTNFTFNCLDSTSAERVDLDCTCDMSYLDAVTHLHCYPNGKKKFVSVTNFGDN